jgi:alpha-L-fucosidase
VPQTAPDPVATIIKLDLKEKLPYRKIVSNSEKTFEILDL